MALLILHAPSLRALAEEVAQGAMPELEAEDSRDDYSIEDGDGVWIGRYIGWMEEIVRLRCGLPGFAFHDDYIVNDRLFGEIPSPHVRALLIEFTNRVYPAWKDEAVELPGYDDVHSDCRSYCEGCEDAYREIHGSYEGPLADDVEDDENLDEPGITPEERAERIERNAAREDERLRRREAQEDAESEVLDAEWACEDDCDGFTDYFYDAFRDRVEVDTASLSQDWNTFLAEKGERDFPPLIVELARAATY